MSQQYILNRLMQTGGSSCGCGSESSSQFGAGCGSESSIQFGGKVSLDPSKWTFVFFNEGKANEKTDQHQNFLAHVKIVDDKGKTVKNELTDIQSLIKSMKDKPKYGFYVDENILYGKVNKMAFKANGGSQNIELIDLKRKAVKEVIGKVKSKFVETADKISEGIKNATDKFKNGLLTEGDDIAVATAILMVKALSDESRMDRSGNVLIAESAQQKFIKQLEKLNIGINCNIVEKQFKTGGFTESFNDNKFINSVLGMQDDPFIYSDSDYQSGGSISFRITMIKPDTPTLETAIKDINGEITKSDGKLKDVAELKDLLINSVIWFEKENNWSR